MSTSDREPPQKREQPKSVLDALRRGFDATQQSVTVGKVEVSLAIPNCGPCQVREIVPDVEDEGGYSLEFTWPGSQFHFKAMVSSEGRLFSQTSSPAGEGFASTVTAKPGESNAEALAKSLQRFMESPVIFTRAQPAEA